MWWPSHRGGLCFGGDYNPEQWPRQVWREDVALMREAGVTLVTVGVFSWALLERAPGEFTFEWLDEVLDLLAEAGIAVNLATPTASPPPWFSLEHPDALPVSADGVRLTHGSRDTYCAAAPAYRTAARNIAVEIGTRYAGHPALAMWHVHNEYGTACHCGHAAGAFRRWLRSRYDDSLDRLNECWGTAFWSQHYTDWEQVQPMRATRYLPNPHQALDFRRFWSDELLAAYCEQRDVLRAAAPGIPVTTNFVFGSWVPVDHARWSNEVDLVGVDCYPSSAGPDAEEFTAFYADLARSWSGGRPWLLMEQAPSTINHHGVMVPKRPGRMTRLSLSCVARGSLGAMFFQWRASAAGAERFHSALVPHAGPQSRVFAETRELGASLAALGEAAVGTVEADVAIAWDAASWWALDHPHLPSSRVDYLESVRSVHRALFRAGITTDVTSLDDDLVAYRLVLVPCHYLASAASAERVRRYVEAGGQVAIWYLSGVADEYGRVRTGGYPGAFRDLLGVRVEEFHPLPVGERVSLSGGGAASVWTEDVQPVDADVVDSYIDGGCAGRPAITRKAAGRGVAWYVSCDLDDDRLRGLVTEMAGDAGVVPGIAACLSLKVVRRRSGAASWLFAINHGDTPADVDAGGTDLMTGRDELAPITVPAGGWRVIRER